MNYRDNENKKWKKDPCNFVMLFKIIIDFFSFVKTPATHKSSNADLRLREKKYENRNFCYLPTWFFNQLTGGISLSAVHSSNTFTAVIMLFNNCEFGYNPPKASRYVKDSGTFDSSKDYPRMEPHTIWLKALTSVNDITTTLWEAKLELLYMYICTTVSVYMLWLMKNEFFHAQE